MSPKGKPIKTSQPNSKGDRTKVSHKQEQTDQMLLIDWVSESDFLRHVPEPLFNTTFMSSLVHHFVIKMVFWAYE